MITGKFGYFLAQLEIREADGTCWIENGFLVIDRDHDESGGGLLLQIGNSARNIGTTTTDETTRIILVIISGRSAMIISIVAKMKQTSRVANALPGSERVLGFSESVKALA
ncbi:hypothetical protein FOL47_002915 [Perkinsus chesapeaki]|uniref:Uncharacterized protein n=1 Tax=Perkinsus chesapeaki TaxID=330153 RepID=A0A7J6MAV0_PERCH|nr:hypothetical protein FOL47_002915 [Perkinsus chesapeaki]